MLVFLRDTYTHTHVFFVTQMHMHAFYHPALTNCTARAALPLSLFTIKKPRMTMQYTGIEATVRQYFPGNHHIVYLIMGGYATLFTLSQIRGSFTSAAAVAALPPPEVPDYHTSECAPSTWAPPPSSTTTPHTTFSPFARSPHTPRTHTPRAHHAPPRTLPARAPLLSSACLRSQKGVRHSLLWHPRVGGVCEG